MNAVLTLAALVLTSTPAPSPAMPTVRIVGFAFTPARLTVAAGTTIRFVNQDAEAHTVTSAARSFDSGGLDTGDAWTHRFATAGTFAYVCALHPYMRGVIVVTK